MANVLREPLTTVGYSGSYGYGTQHYNKILTTADATATVLLEVVVAELEGCLIEGAVLGVQDDGTNSIVRHIICGGNRATAGNVTSAGSAGGTDIENEAGTPAVTLNANTTNQTLEIKVAGIAAQNWKWEGHFSVTKIK